VFRVSKEIVPEYNFENYSCRNTNSENYSYRNETPIQKITLTERNTNSENYSYRNETPIQKITLTETKHHFEKLLLQKGQFRIYSCRNTNLKITLAEMPI